MTSSVPPHSLEAEQALLGSLLLSPSLRPDVFSLVAPGDFYRPAHTAIYGVMQGMFLADEAIDHLSLADRLRASGDLERVGGEIYLLDVTQVVPTSANALQYAAMVKRDSKLRATIEAAAKAMSLAYAGDETAPDVGLGLMLGVQDTGRSQSEQASAVAERRLKAYLTPTPSIAIPGSAQRLHYGDTIVIAGFEGSGKTALAIQCLDVWRQKDRCLFLSYEMTADEIVDRFISRHVRIPTERALEGLDEDDIAVYRTDCASLLADRNLRIKECAGMRPEQLYSTIRSFGASGGKVAVIDYIQIARRMNVNDERIAIDELMLYIQQAGKSSGVACVALSQYSRLKDGESEPRVANLRGSGSIGQAAANVALMWAAPDDKQKPAKQALFEKGWMVDPDDRRILVRIEWGKARHSAKSKEYFLFNGSEMHFEPVEMEPDRKKGRR